MLLSMVDVISCENPRCREFARIVPLTPEARSYYCPVCGEISYARSVDAKLAVSPERYKEYLRTAVLPQNKSAPA